jgi:hypothetical protein
MHSSSHRHKLERLCGRSMTNHILTLAAEFKGLRSKWQTLSLYERFEQTIVAALILVIALIVALTTWQLLLHTLRLVSSHVLNPGDPQVFQGLFGMVLTVLIAWRPNETRWFS